MTDATALFNELVELRRRVSDQGRELLLDWDDRLDGSAYRASATNLAHYLALRQRDLRALQEALMVRGLSSLGRCEARVIPTLDATLLAAAALAGVTPPPQIRPTGEDHFFAGTHALQANTAALFGPCETERSVHIMVTMATELAEDYDTVEALVRAGMRVARINCAKDDAAVWQAITTNVRRAGAVLGVPVRVAFDLCGPRSRTETTWARTNRRAMPGDTILLTNHPAAPDERFDFVVQSSLTEATAQLPPGAAVTIDEGALRCVVESCHDGARGLRVTRSGPRGVRLKPNKGINFPHTTLQLDPLTPKDRRDLDHITGLADIIGYSFVQRADDVANLQRELRHRDAAASVGIIAKIETSAAVENLPEIIVQGAARGPFGVMIARGDLAVEIGFQRLAEIQEELLWLCEAAHVPVVWATEVMSSTVRTGNPTRSEMTDAAMAERAECVMLNKGPFLVLGVEVLAKLLSRMEGHQKKKVSRLRALKTW
jgi:pyruvate kinase